MQAYDLPLREQDSYDSDDVTDSPVASPMFAHLHRRRAVDTPPKVGMSGAMDGAAQQRTDVGTNALDGKYLAPLLIIPWGFGMFAIITEASAGNFVGAAAALWWHFAFWLASAIGTQRPVMAIFLSITALACPLRFEQDIMVRSMHSMAWITHFLRLITMINEPGYFDFRNWKFRVLFVHYYHDLRFASPVDSVNAEVQYMLPSMLVAILMVVVVDSSSFEKVKTKWFPKISLHASGVPFLLIGTKADIRNDKEYLSRLRENGQKPVSEEMGRQLAASLGAHMYLECSALTQEDILRVTQEALRRVLKSKPFPPYKSKLSSSWCKIL